EGLLDLADWAAFDGSVRRVKTFRDDAIEIATGFLKPFAGSSVIRRCWRQAHMFGRSKIQTRESFEKSAAIAQTVFQQYLAVLGEQIEDDVRCWMKIGRASCRER